MRSTSKVEAILSVRGSTKRWLAKRLRMHETQLNKYLKGALPPPVDLYARIADELQVPVSMITPSEPKEPAVA